MNINSSFFFNKQGSNTELNQGKQNEVMTGKSKLQCAGTA